MNSAILAPLHPEFAQKNAQNAAPDSLTERKLRKSAQEFEAMLLAKWWSSMKESGLGGLDETDPGHDTLDQLGMQALSTAVAGSGGIGLGDLLVRGVLSNIRGTNSELGGSSQKQEATEKTGD